jgi:hypothetical protein
VQAHAPRRPSPRGAGDVTVQRDLLTASPRQQTSEMLSAAPGIFVDHEDGEGLGNDVFLRGFDLEHGAGIEMRVGWIPINVPLHVQGQGYADASFILPEVVQRVRVQEGPFDPRQGDAAIVGSATFDLGVPERGYRAKVSYGSFGQARVAGVAAPRGEDDATFAAFSLRRTGGFGVDRDGESGAVMAQYALDVGPRDRIRLLAAGHGARASLPGVVRQDDVDAGRIPLDGEYPYFARNQGVRTSRVLAGFELDHAARDGGHFVLAPWIMGTTFRARRNFTGDLETSRVDPTLSGAGDLFEATNDETALGVASSYRFAPARLGDVGDVTIEPGLAVRGGAIDQARSLLDPTTLAPWDRRLDAHLRTLDGGAYVDAELRLFRRFHISGGARADLLAVAIDDRLAGVLPGNRPPSRSASGVALSPRVSVQYDVTDALSPVVSYGEGFRSLDAESLGGGARPYSKVRSVEVGVRARARGERVAATFAVFETWVDNELVFEAAAGGLTTESASTRRGVVASVVLRPNAWLLASSALSVTSATFSTLVAGVSHDVPSVPPVVYRTDVTARGPITCALEGRIGVGYTFLAGRHLTDAIVGPATHALNAGASVRHEGLEIGIDAYNLLGFRYADDAEVYVSNWSFAPGQSRASVATHLVAAPPTTILATVTASF